MASGSGWIALLRAINVGGRNRVPMAGLRETFAAAGCEDVRTYIQSGNVLFTTGRTGRDALATRLERAIEDAFGVSSTVILRTAAELGEVLAAHPFGADTTKTHVSFLVRKPTAAAIRRLGEVEIAPDRLEVVGREVYLLYPNGVQGTKLSGATLAKHLGVEGTTRNWRTVARLADLAGE